MLASGITSRKFFLHRLPSYYTSFPTNPLIPSLPPLNQSLHSNSIVLLPQLYLLLHPPPFPLPPSPNSSPLSSLSTPPSPFPIFLQSQTNKSLLFLPSSQLRRSSLHHVLLRLTCPMFPTRSKPFLVLTTPLHLQLLLSAPFHLLSSLHLSSPPITPTNPPSMSQCRAES